MPVRGFAREQGFLLPIDPDDMVAPTHAARFIAAFVDQLEPADWLELAIRPKGNALGAPAYHPRLLLGIWLYGLFVRVLKARRLEVACQEAIPFMWLAGQQHPDHNTLWRFYQRNQKQVRKIFKASVKTGAAIGLFDPAVQALDGTKIAANAARERTYNAAQLERLGERVNLLLDELERVNREEEETALLHPRLPQELANATALRERIRSALEQVKAADGPQQVNLTDPDCTVMKGRHGFIVGFNAQAMVSPIPEARLGKPGLFITAVDVVTDASDQAQLVGMIEAARETGVVAEVTLADAGYHSSANLAACAELGQRILMPESTPVEVLEQPFHKDRFRYHPEDDTYRCPEDQVLHFWKTRRRRGEAARVYRAGEACRGCPFFGTCVKEGATARTIEIGPHDEVLQAHRAQMRTDDAKQLYALRKILNEPVFGILKEHDDLRRFRVRGLDQVRNAWAFRALGFNLRSLYLAWRMRPAGETWRFASIAGA